MNIITETSYDRCIVCDWIIPLAAPYPGELHVMMICDICILDTAQAVSAVAASRGTSRQIYVRVAPRFPSKTNRGMDKFIADQGVEAFRRLPRRKL